jgi:hypothetical protein
MIICDVPMTYFYGWGVAVLLSWYLSANLNLESSVDKFSKKVASWSVPNSCLQNLILRLQVLIGW